MKKYTSIILLVLCSILLIGCGKKESAENAKWDCTVTCVEESTDDAYVITYSNERVVSNTGVLTIQNRNDFDIKVHLLAEGQEERTTEVMAGCSSIFYQIVQDTEYMVGCHADVAEGTEVKLTVYDGARSEPY